MPSNLAFLAAFLTVGSVAEAEPAASAPTSPADVTASASADVGYLGVGLELLIAETTYAGPTVEGARRLGQTPWLVRGMIGGGSLSSGIAPGTNRFGELRLGVEADGCTPGRHACAFAGVDLGLLDETFTRDDQMAMSHRSFLVLPRLGLEIGGKTLRLRSALEYNIRSAAGLQLALLLHF
jgi:hypothetical protein